MGLNDSWKGICLVYYADMMFKTMLPLNEHLLCKIRE